eukprot:Lankesteria_metandrocarpae@DN172_c0_g1_i1.p1
MACDLLNVNLCLAIVENVTNAKQLTESFTTSAPPHVVSTETSSTVVTPIAKGATADKNDTTDSGNDAKDGGEANFQIQSTPNGNTPNGMAVGSPVIVYISPRTVHGVTHLVGAVMRALSRWRAGKMKTRTLQTELLWCLSPSAQISEALSNIPISSVDTEVVVLSLFTSSEEFTEVCSKIEGIIKVRCDNFGKTLMNASLSNAGTTGSEDQHTEAVRTIALADDLCKVHSCMEYFKTCRMTLYCVHHCSAE